MAKAPKLSIDSSLATDSIDPLAREALAWIVHLHSGDETSSDWASFEEWKATSADHAAAASKATMLWQGLQPALQSYRRPKGRRMALMLVAVLGLGAAGAALELPSMATLLADYRTGTGELRTVTLKDGSQVDLDTGTSFDVSADHRTVTLHAGQVFVAVAPDPGRPFRVVTAKAETMALGTAFAVRVDPDRDRIVVTEHAVRVTPTSGEPQSGVRLSAGQSIEIGSSGIGAPRGRDVGAMTSWRNGELHFRDQPFAAVAAEIERYRHGRILIVGHALARLPVTGNFDVRHTDTFLDAAALALPVRMMRLPGLVVIWRDEGRSLPSR